MYETFEHTADVGLRVRADDLETLFAEAGRGFFSLIVSEPGSVRATQEVSIELSAEPLEFLFFDWLNELLYTYEARRLLLAEFNVHIGPSGLRATAQGEPVDLDRHALDHEVKAITYHGLKLEEVAGQWLAEVIVDI